MPLVGHLVAALHLSQSTSCPCWTDVISMAMGVGGSITSLSSITSDAAITGNRAVAAGTTVSRPRQPFACKNI